MLISTKNTIAAPGPDVTFTTAESIQNQHDNDQNLRAAYTSESLGCGVTHDNKEYAVQKPYNASQTAQDVTALHSDDNKAHSVQKFHDSSSPNAEELLTGWMEEVHVLGCTVGDKLVADGIQTDDLLCKDDDYEANMSSEHTPVKSSSNETQVRHKEENHVEESFSTTVRGMRVPGDAQMQISTKTASGTRAQSGVLKTIICFTCGVVVGVALTATFFVWSLSQKRVFPVKVY